MAALAKAVSLLLILLTATASPAWCWTVLHAPSQDPLDQPVQFAHASFAQGCLPDLLGSRSMPVDMTWLSCRASLTGMMAGPDPVASAAGMVAHALAETGESSQGGSATTSLIALHSQLTV